MSQYEGEKRYQQTTAEYKVIKTIYIGELEEEISKLLMQGWNLSGGLVLDGKYYAQAVWKISYNFG